MGGLQQQTALFRQIYGYVIMTYSGKKSLNDMRSFDFQAGGVDTGMAADIFRMENLFVYGQFHPVVFIIHKSQHAYRSRGKA